ncbi:MAG: hypothetical protein Kow0079_04790 [Vicingaceae bacterium]
MARIFKILFLFLILWSSGIYSNTNNIDSLIQVTDKLNKSFQKADNYLKISEYYQTSDFDKALHYSQKALVLSKELKYDEGLANAYNYIGYTLTDLGEFEKALDHYDKSIAICKKIKNLNGEAIAYNDKGYIYQTIGQIQHALESYFDALKILEQLNDSIALSACLNNIGLLYQHQGDHQKAFEYLNKSIAIKEHLKNDKSLGTAYNNIGALLYDEKRYDEALNYFEKGLFYRKKAEDLPGIAQSLINIGAIYREKQQNNEAIRYFNEALELNRKTNNIIDEISCLNSLGIIYKRFKDFDKSLFYLHQAYSLAKDIGALDKLKESAGALSSIYAYKGEYKNAYVYFMQFNDLQDSLNNEDKVRAITRLEMQYNFDKEIKERELEALKKDLAYQKELSKQKVVSYSLIIGLSMLFILLIVIYYSFVQKKKANIEIQRQKLIIEDKNIQLEQALKDITDSVQYAKKIQTAILPSFNLIRKHIPHCDVFYLPKDIVSGDFYWFSEIKGKLILAVVDCTGHGVPGALMSTISYNGLNKIINENNITNPDLILLNLDKYIKEILHASKDNEVNDGMDIAICCIEEIASKHPKVQFAGAYNSLLVIRNGEIIELKADKRSIGSNVKEKEVAYTKHYIELQENDSVYMFSDGYADQFGEKNNKKFMYKRFKSLLADISHQPIQDQIKIIKNTFYDWKGNLEQIDDICVLGFKI